MCVLVPLMPLLLQGCFEKSNTILQEQNAASAVPEGRITGEYTKFSSLPRTSVYSNAEQSFVREDKMINFDFGNSGPFGGTNEDNFMIRWKGYLVPPQSGTYILCTCADDGTKLFIDGENKISTMAYTEQGARFWGTAPMTLEAGRKYPFKLEYYEASGPASVKLYWIKDPGTDDWNQVCYGNRKDNGAMDPSCNPDAVVVNPAMQIVPSVAYAPLEPEHLTSQMANYQSCTSDPALTDPDTSLDGLDEKTLGEARKLYERLSGVAPASFDSRVIRVASLLKDGRKKDAARAVTEDPGFFERVVRPFAAQISTAAERSDVELNDFIATVIGATRDRLDARKLLTGGFIYRASPDLFWAEQSIYNRASTLSSNGHYRAIQQLGTPLACALDRLDRSTADAPPSHMRQMLALPDSGDTAMTVNPVPAGLLTSRSFAEAHLVAGTNRRAVQKSFEYFLCAPIDSYRDTDISDYYVGRDVERFPDGPNSYNQFTNVCKSCHGALDAMRPAFSAHHFENGILKYAPLFTANPRSVNSNAENLGDMRVTPDDRRNPASTRTSGPYLPVHWKLNHNINYPDGYFVADSQYHNLLTSSAHLQHFGWNGSIEGNGIREFGRMIANSAAFPKCMAKRVYKQVCGADPFAADFPAEMASWLDRMAEDWANSKYDLRDLFETMGAACSN